MFSVRSNATLRLVRTLSAEERESEVYSVVALEKQANRVANLKNVFAKVVKYGP